MGEKMDEKFGIVPKGNSCAAKNRRNRINRMNKLIKRDGDKCFYCGRVMKPKDMTVEHLKAKANGGANDLENLRLAHQECNVKAGALPVKKKLKMVV